MQPTSATLAGGTALITGASSGIGRGIALALADCGSHLRLVGRDSDELDLTASRARAGSPDVKTFSLDLTAAGATAEFQAQIATWDRLDVLVHCAGVMAMGPMATATLAELDAQWEVNVRALYALTKACLPALTASHGQVVFINSSITLHPRGGLGQYAATEAAVRAIADSLRDEVNASGVRVLSVFPGRTATPRQEWIHAAEGRPYTPERLMQPEDVAAAVVSALQLPRTAEITDIHIRPFQKPV